MTLLRYRFTQVYTDSYWESNTGSYDSQSLVLSKTEVWMIHGLKTLSPQSPALKISMRRKDTAHQGWGERHLPSSPRPGFEPWSQQSRGGGWEGLTPASCPLGCDDHSLPPKKENNCKKYFKNPPCYFWFSPNLTLNSLLWIWRLSDNVVNQYIDAACIIYSENHMGGRRNHFWLQYVGRTSSSWGQSASHHHLRGSSKHLHSLPWQQEMLQDHSDTATAYCS